jgi:hypothetical protein
MTPLKDILEISSLYNPKHRCGKSRRRGFLPNSVDNTRKEGGEKIEAEQGFLPSFPQDKGEI